MKELEEFLEKELNGLALKKADWGYLTIEDDSRERTLLEVQGVVKKLPIHIVVGRSEQLVCDVCGSNDVVEAPHMGRNCNICHPL